MGWGVGRNYILWVPLNCFEGQHIKTPIQLHFVARNSLLVKQLFAYAILGFILIEAITLFALMMVFLILFSF
jgi:hypothetical protein